MPPKRPDTLVIDTLAIGFLATGIAAQAQDFSWDSDGGNNAESPQFPARSTPVLKT